jgi:hypothetical protein
MGRRIYLLYTFHVDLTGDTLIAEDYEIIGFHIMKFLLDTLQYLYFDFRLG